MIPQLSTKHVLGFIFYKIWMVGLFLRNSSFLALALSTANIVNSNYLRKWGRDAVIDKWNFRFSRVVYYRGSVLTFRVSGAVSLSLYTNNRINTHRRTPNYKNEPFDENTLVSLVLLPPCLRCDAKLLMACRLQK